MIPIPLPLIAALKSQAQWLLTNVLDPRFWLIVVIIFGLGFVKGCSDRAEKAEAFEREVARIGAQAKERVREVIVQQKVIDQEAVNALKRDKVRLARDNATLLESLQHHASRSVLPPTAPPAGGDKADDPVACFDRGGFNEQFGGVLQRYAERLAAIAGEGENTAAGLRACVAWAEGQARLGERGGNESESSRIGSEPFSVEVATHPYQASGN